MQQPHHPARGCLVAHAGGYKMAPVPQLAADDVTHGGDGALAEQVGWGGEACLNF